MKVIRIGIDESGTFGSGNYFVLAAYVILDTKYKSKIAKYRNLEKTIYTNREVKASQISSSQKHQLLDVMKNQPAYIAYINQSQIKFPSAALDKQLLKDDLIIQMLESIIRDSRELENTKVIIYIDEQNMRNGLKDNVYIQLYKLLNSGYFKNYRYVKGIVKPPVELEVVYVDSKQKTLVRAADNLANYIHNLLRKEQQLPAHIKIFKVL